MKSSKHLSSSVLKGITLLLLIIPNTTGSANAQKTVIHAPMSHLRSGPTREWTSFPEVAGGSKLDIAFRSNANLNSATLGLRRVDIKEGWNVRLNGDTIATLFSDENPMEEFYEIPPGKLKDGDNALTIEATSDKVDDVLIGAIWIDPREPSLALSESTLELFASDATGSPLPCRFTIIDEQGMLAANYVPSSPDLAIRSGVVYSATGHATVHLPLGKYTIHCGRGFEYSVETTQVELMSNRSTTLRFQPQRVVNTHGLIAMDPHVHTYELSRHGDASLIERFVTLAGEGIEMPVATDHNMFVDYLPRLSATKMRQFMTPVVGNEVTSRFGHFNIFPASADATIPNTQIEDWKTLSKEIFATPSVKVCILNHARDQHAGFIPFGPQNMVAAVAQRLDGRELCANAMEVINSAALKSDPMLLAHDWMTCLNRGHHLAPIGSSDSHEVSRKIVGQGRTYVYGRDEKSHALDVQAIANNIARGAVLVSMGLLVEMTIDDEYRAGDQFQPASEMLGFHVRVDSPAWTRAEVFELYANGQLVASQPINADASINGGRQTEIRLQLPTPHQDTHYIAIARGPGVTELYWPIAKPYQPSSTDWNPYVFGCTGAIFCDASKDGKFTSAFEYAKQAVEATAGRVPDLIAALNDVDPSVPPFVAELLSAESPLDLSAWSDAAPHVKQGLESYLQSQRESLQANLRSR